MNKSTILRIFALVVFCLYTSGIQAQFDYEDALATSLLFFDANKCGPNAGADNVYSWRGACHVNDGSEAGIDLTGGFHDAGDHVKFGLPQTWTAATLGFALYEFREAFDNSGATPEMLSTLKYFTDFFLKSHVNANTFYYNVGDGNADHGYWGPPEDQTGARPLIAATPSTPASDVCGEAAAALALMYLNYQNVDAAYANTCLQHAIEIFELGRNYLGRSSDGGGGNFYESSSHFDDLSWGAIWLSIATGDDSYLDPVFEWIEVENDYGDDPYNKQWAPAWDDVTVYALLKLYQLTGIQKYYDGVINNLEWYRDDCQRTPFGLPWLDSWGVLRYASSEAGVGYLAAKYFEYAGYLETANLTMDYCLGDNPRNSSYLTGWGNNPPVHPHHRANEPNRDGNTNGILGALVGGPGNSDNYQDNVNDYTMNEVAIDYNASFILGLAGRIYFEYHEPPQPNVPPSVTLTSPSSGGSYEQGETILLSANASDSDGTVELVEFLVGGTKVGEDASAPYSINWTIVLAGDYTVSARAIDDKLASGYSNEVSITATSNLPEPTTPNLALDKPATASSLENDGFPASYAVDGSYGSRWASEFSDPQWLQVDLQAEYSINRVILTWETAAGSAYQIQVSDDASSWNTVATIGGGNGGEDDIAFDLIDARYVRMYGTERTTPYGYSLFEMEVYGPEGDVNTPPTAVAAASPVSGDFPFTVSFSAAGSEDPDGSIVSYAWEFGDGNTGSGESASNTYTSPGSYLAVLTVTDNEGATDNASVTIVVTDPGQDNQPPVAIISATPTSGTEPLSVSFDGSASADPDGDPLSFVWDFGDGSGSTATSPSHNYAAAGTYVAELTVSDGELSASDQVTITVTPSGGGDCSNPMSISLPFQQNGAGEYCYFTDGTISYINSWNMQVVEVNGIDITNVWSNNMPARQDGGYYIYYQANVGWAHMEIDGTDDSTEPEIYTLNTSVTGQGSVSPADGSYEEGTLVTLTATPAAGWVFDGWSGDASGTSSSVSVTMDSDKSVSAAFIEDIEPPVEYELTVSVTGQGSVSPAGGTFEEGTVVTLTATPAAGWLFDGWSGDASGTSSSVSVTMDGDKSVSAAFIQDTPPEGCDNPVAISIPFVQNGAGEYCWVTTTEIAYINSWNLDELTINGVDFTNTWSNNLPPAVNGEWVIHYVGSYAWSHFEAPAAKSAHELSENTAVSVFPNPFTDQITINVEGLQDVRKIEVLNNMGQTVKYLGAEELTGSGIIIQIQAAPGIYLLRIQTSEEIIVKTLVKE